MRRSSSRRGRGWRGLGRGWRGLNGRRALGRFFGDDRGAPGLVRGAKVKVDLAGRELSLVDDGVGLALVLGADPEGDGVAFQLALVHFGGRGAGTLNRASHHIAGALEVKNEFGRSA